QVQPRDAVMQPSVVLDDSAVGHSAVPAGEPGDCAFDHWPMPAVGGLEVGVGGAFTVFTLEQIVLVQLDGAALLGGGASRPQRAVRTCDSENGFAALGDSLGHPCRAGQRPGNSVVGEVVDGETALDCGL